MSEHTTVVTGGNSNGVAILGIIVVLVLLIGALIWFGGASLFPNQINVDVNQPANPPAQAPQPQPQPEQPQPNPMSYHLELPVVSAG